VIPGMTAGAHQRHGLGSRRRALARMSVLEIPRRAAVRRIIYQLHVQDDEVQPRQQIRMSLPESLPSRWP